MLVTKFHNSFYRAEKTVILDEPHHLHFISFIKLLT
jgi:hypothetical protein